MHTSNDREETQTQCAQICKPESVSIVIIAHEDTDRLP
jgi:hypothetical protein